ncbi:hypothetical protein Hypma_005243, partial [Hypsizygus marmoreus]
MPVVQRAIVWRGGPDAFLSRISNYVSETNNDPLTGYFSIAFAIPDSLNASSPSPNNSIGLLSPEAFAAPIPEVITGWIFLAKRNPPQPASYDLQPDRRNGTLYPRPNDPANGPFALSLRLIRLPTIPTPPYFTDPKNARQSTRELRTFPPVNCQAEDDNDASGVANKAL